MDPQTALNEILTMLAKGAADDREAIVERLEALSDWIRNHGYYPHVHSVMGIKSPNAADFHVPRVYQLVAKSCFK